MEKEKYSPYVGVLKDFIKHNSLTFMEGCRNSDLVVLCGYSLYSGAEKKDVETVLEEKLSVDAELVSEFNFVYSYAKKNNYGDWWNNPKNKNCYYTCPSDK